MLQGIILDSRSTDEETEVQGSIFTQGSWEPEEAALEPRRVRQCGKEMAPALGGLFGGPHHCLDALL
jgi:hypothetical protein